MVCPYENIIGRSNLSKKWNARIEPFFDGLRASMGRQMLRNGNVRKIEIERNVVSSTVIDGHDTFNVRVDFNEISDTDRNKIIDKMGDSAIMGFIDVDLSSFIIPEKKDVSMSCDKCGNGIFCKHSAAVLYGIATMLDEDQNLIFTLRGIDTAALIGNKVRDRYSEMISKANASSPRIIPDDLAKKLFKF